MEIKNEDGGTGSPFVARLLLTILQFRDKTGLNDDKRKQFDAIYERFYDHAKLAYLSNKELSEINKKYVAEVEKGTVVSIQNNVLLVRKEIDTDARRLTYSILSEAEIAYKEIISGYTKLFDAPDLGFMLQEDKKFKKGLLNIREKDLILADYLESNRNAWTGKLNKIRNEKEHGGWKLPEYHFNVVNGDISVVYPRIDGIGYIEYLQYILASLFTFAEELIVDALNRCVPYEYVYEIPRDERRIEIAARFDMCFVGDIFVPWVLQYKGPDMELIY